MLYLVRSWISSNKIKCWFLGSSVWVETCQGTVSPARTLRVWHGFRSKPMPWTMSPVSITLFKKGFYPLKENPRGKKVSNGWNRRNNFCRIWSFTKHTPFGGMNPSSDGFWHVYFLPRFILLVQWRYWPNGHNYCM